MAWDSQRSCLLADSLREGDEDSAYRSFCVHVRNLVGVICGVELALIVWGFTDYSQAHPFSACRADNLTLLRGIGRGQAQLAEGQVCSTSTLILTFTAFHVVCDLLTLLAIFVERHKLVLPLLVVLVLNIVVSFFFLCSAMVAFLFSSTSYSAFFVLFVLLQAGFRFYEFVCARRLYWHFQTAADRRHWPRSSLLRPEDETEESSFQF